MLTIFVKFSKNMNLFELKIALLPFLNFFFLPRNYMIKGLGIFGYTTPALLGAWLRMFSNLEPTHQSLMNKDVLVGTTKLLNFSIFSFILYLKNYRANIQMQISHMLISSQ